MRIFKKLSVLLILAILLSFTACSGGPELEEIRARAQELLVASTELNSIYYGEGLPVITEAYTGNDYYYVNIEESKYDSAEELKNATSAVYTTDYCEGIFETMFVGISNDIGSVLPRFIEDDGGALMQDKYLVNILPGERVFIFDTMVIEKSTKNRVVLRVSATLNGEKDEDAVVELRLENGVWLLNSSTY